MTAERLVACTCDAGLAAQIRGECTARGARAVVVEEPADCLDALEVSPARVVLLDDAGSEETVALLDSVRGRFPGLPVVWLTTAHSPERETLVRRRGVLYYAAKPVRDGVLGRFVDVIAGRKAPGRASADSAGAV